VLRANEFRMGPNDAFALRLAVFFIAIFFIVGCYMPFLPLWLKWRGLTDFQISLIYAVPVFLRALFTPAMTFAADRSGRPARLLYWLSWGSLLCILTLPFTDGFPAIFTVIVLFTLFWMSVIPITDSIALAGARTGRGDYGRMRLWGSLSYIAMTSAGGVAVDLWGPAAALWLFIGAAICVVMAVHWLPEDARPAPLVEEPPGPLQPKLRFADIGELLRHPLLWLFFAATSAIQSAHAVYYIFGTLHWTSAGIAPTIIGALWGIGVIAEIILFAYGTSVSRFFNPVQLLAIAGAAAALRWTITAFNPPLPALFLTQTLHGLTFGAAHLGAMQFMTRAIPRPLAVSVQGLYASITMGVGMGLASLAAGPLYRNFAGSAYLAMTVLGFCGLLAALLLMRRWQGGLIVEARLPLQPS
jgi:PPP family 3-phenylpropionic acid transporter